MSRALSVDLRIRVLAAYPSGVDRLASFWRYRDFALLRVDLRAQ